MPSTFRARIAIVLILGIFLIPILVSSLRGLTHVLACEEAVESPFTVVVSAGGNAVVTSSASGEAGTSSALCGGLSVDMKAGRVANDRMNVTISVTNNSEYPWQGTVDLSLNGSMFPIAIGRIDPGVTESDSVPLRLGEGTTELDGTLLVGP